MASVMLVGSTGLVGSHVLSTLMRHTSVQSVLSITRRKPEAKHDKLSCVTEPDSNLWTESISSASPPPDIFISALGTTRSQGQATTRRIDHDLNIALATAAKARGATVYVLVTTHGADSSSFFEFFRRKGQIEDAIREIGFETTIFLRPGYISGRPQSRELAEKLLEGIVNVGNQYWRLMVDGWNQPAEVIARAAVDTALQALTVQGGKGLIVLDQKGIRDAGHGD